MRFLYEYEDNNFYVLRGSFAGCFWDSVLSVPKGDEVRLDEEEPLVFSLAREYYFFGIPYPCHSVGHLAAQTRGRSRLGHPFWFLPAVRMAFLMPPAVSLPDDRQIAPAAVSRFDPFAGKVRRPQKMAHEQQGAAFRCAAKNVSAPGRYSPGGRFFCRLVRRGNTAE